MGMSFDNVMDIMGVVMDETDSLIMGIGIPNAEDDPAMWNEWHFIPPYPDDGQFLDAVSEVINVARTPESVETSWKL